MSPPAGTAPPALEAAGLVVTIDGVPSLRGDVTCAGPRVLWVGEAEALVGAVGGLPADPETGRGVAEVSEGSLRLHGHEVASGEHRPHTGVAPPLASLPMPHEPLEVWLRWGARARGASRAASRALAKHAIDRMDLGSIARHRPHQLGPLQRRAAALALAIVHDPPLALFAHPLDELPPDALGPMLEWLGRATRDRRSIVTTAGDAPLLTLLGGDASDIVLVQDGTIVATPSPEVLSSPRRLYLLELEGDAEAFARALEPSVELEGAGEGLASAPAEATAPPEANAPPEATDPDPGAGPCHRLLASLPPGASATVLLRAAQDSGTAVLSCVPLLG